MMITSWHTQAGTMVPIMMTSSIIMIMKSSMLAHIMMISLWCACTPAHHDVVVMTSRSATLRAQARW
jgi:hypothetical protein